MKDPIIEQLQKDRQAAPLLAQKAAGIVNQAVSLIDSGEFPEIQHEGDLLNRLRAFRHQALSLREHAAALLKPYTEAEREIRADIAAAPKGAFPNQEARETETTDRMRKLPDYLAVKDEAAATLAAVARLEIEAAYLEHLVKNARAEIYRQAVREGLEMA